MSFHLGIFKFRVIYFVLTLIALNGFLGIFNCSVADYVAQNSDNNYSSQFKNLDKLVSSLNSEILSKLDGSTGTGSSSNLQR